ncbi:nucleoside/nucleotide kinase family protein [Saccharospirillum sp.]|uniref:nucleoside/nucleotide kinase family protein n=1 Tax=Saccharospirillum sp. TaxID=2033801 RepID=UPI0034A09230
MAKHSLESLISELQKRAEQPKRTLVGIVGAPGAGKSTLVERLQQAVGEERCAVVPMDGYHLDNAILDANDWRMVKGAPHTFDVAGLALSLKRLAAAEEDLYLPVFDRALDLARAGALRVTTAQRLVLVEGNYLLLDQAPWNELASLFDLKVYLDVPMETLEQRLTQRWLDHGFDADMAHKKVSGNDLPNARLVVQKTVRDTETVLLSL